MFSGISIFSVDAVWQQILSDLNATIVSDVGVADVDFDSLHLNTPVTVMQLKVAVFSAMDNSEIVSKIFGRDVEMPRLHRQIITCLDKNGGMRASDLRRALGYSPNVTTHAVDTAIYQMRRAYGREFIINDNGIYRIGHI